jgi:hypothetical protein
LEALRGLERLLDFDTLRGLERLLDLEALRGLERLRDFFKPFAIYNNILY